MYSASSDATADPNLGNHFRKQSALKFGSRKDAQTSDYNFLIFFFLFLHESQIVLFRRQFLVVLLQFLAENPKEVLPEKIQGL